MFKKMEWMSFDEKQRLKEKVKDIVFAEMHKLSYLKEQEEIGAIKSEEDLRVLEDIFKAFEALSDEELYFALTKQFWNAGPKEAKEVVRMVLARRMKKWNMRLLLRAHRGFYLASIAEKIIVERTLQKYKDSEEELKKAATAKNRLISLAAKIALEISSKRKTKIEYMRKALELGPSQDSK